MRFVKWLIRLLKGRNHRQDLINCDCAAVADLKKNIRKDASCAACGETGWFDENGKCFCKRGLKR